MNREYALVPAAVEEAFQDRMRRELDDLRYASNTKKCTPASAAHKKAATIIRLLLLAIAEFVDNVVIKLAIPGTIASHRPGRSCCRCIARPQRSKCEDSPQ